LVNEFFQPLILRFDSIASTNTEAARQAELGAAEGLCVVAREQTAGRGRLGRQWMSGRDAGLYFSIVVRPRFEANRWPIITFAASLAVYEAIERACSVKPDIKWPNDLMINDRKVCGILAERIETGKGAACIVGIGINLTDEAFPPELKDSATSLEATIESVPDRESLLVELVSALSEHYALLYEPDGDRLTLGEWTARSSYAEGRRVRVALASETFEGITRGLEEDGGLRIEIETGEIKTVRAGDVTALRRAAD
jgi:BirA family transcriptional regulator, biotin operon repressor / biotin---[acetyl-CoA-carboxylase] ligase